MVQLGTDGGPLQVDGSGGDIYSRDGQVGYLPRGIEFGPQGGCKKTTDHGIHC